MSLNNLRNKVEAVIVRAVIAEALRLGYRITVENGEEEAIIRSNNASAIRHGCAATDEDRFYFYKDGEECGGVWIIYGEGATCITDYTDNVHLQAILAPAQAIADAALG